MKVLLDGASMQRPLALHGTGNPAPSKKTITEETVLRDEI